VARGPLVLFVVAAVCMGAFLFGERAFVEADTHAHADQAPIDLGPLHAWEQRLTTLRYVNVHERALEVASVDVDCGCMDVLAFDEGPIAPGDVAEVQLLVAPRDSTAPGPLERRVLLRFEGEDGHVAQPVRATVLGEPRAEGLPAELRADADGAFGVEFDYAVPCREPGRVRLETRVGGGPARFTTLEAQLLPGSYLAAHFRLRLSGQLPAGIDRVLLELVVAPAGLAEGAERHPDVVRLHVMRAKPGDPAPER